MVILKKNCTNYKSKFLFFSKIVTILVISWLCLYYNDENTTSKSLECRSKIVISLYIKTRRSLAKQEKRNELENPKIKYQTHDNRDKCTLQNGKESNNTSEQLRRRTPNHIEAYLKFYNQRYAKKKGLKKLECYCEKKVFDKIENICNLAENLPNNKRTFFKKIFNKYTVHLFLIALLPLIGLIFFILFYGERGSRVINWCGIPDGDIHKSTTCNKGAIYHFDIKVMKALNKFNFAISYILIIVVCLVFFYVYIKVIKYRKLKEGKCKISL